MKKIILIFGFVIFLIFSYNLYRVFGGGKKSCFSDDMTDDCYFRKNKFNVYYKITLGKGQSSSGETIIKGADLESFKVLNDYYAMDKNNVYGCFAWYGDTGGFTTKVECRKLKEIDLKTFKSLSLDYAMDKNNVYYLNEVKNGISIIKDADNKTFEIINKNLTKDKNSIYYKGEALNGVDVDSFEVINYYAAKDKNNCYRHYNDDFSKIDISKCKKIEDRKINF